MVIENETEEPVVYRTEDEDPRILPILLAFLAGLVFRVLGLLPGLSGWLLRSKRRRRGEVSDDEPINPEGHLGLGRSNCAGLMLRKRTSYRIPGTDGQDGWRVTVAGGLPPWSASLDDVAGDATLLCYETDGKYYLKTQEEVEGGEEVRET